MANSLFAPSEEDHLLTGTSHDNQSKSSNESTVIEDFDLPDPISHDQDREWMYQLSMYVSQLELKWATTGKPTYRSDLIPSLKVTAEIVNELIKFVSLRLDWSQGEYCLPDILDQAGQYLAIVDEMTNSQKGRWWSLTKSQPPKISISEAAKRYYEFLTILEKSFSALGNRFYQIDAKLKWINFSGDFLAEIQNDLKWTKDQE